MKSVIRLLSLSMLVMLIASGFMAEPERYGAWSMVAVAFVEALVFAVTAYFFFLVSAEKTEEVVILRPSRSPFKMTLVIAVGVTSALAGYLVPLWISTIFVAMAMFLWFSAALAEFFEGTGYNNAWRQYIVRAEGYYVPTLRSLLGPAWWY